MLKKIEKVFLLCHLTWRYNQSSLARTTLPRTNFHGPKGVRAIEVRPYIVISYEAVFFGLLILISAITLDLTVTRKPGENSTIYNLVFCFVTESGAGVEFHYGVPENSYAKTLLGVFSG